MAPDRDVYEATQSLAFPFGSQPEAVPLDETAGEGALFQEINERRARIENAELLRHLRGL